MASNFELGTYAEQNASPAVAIGSTILGGLAGTGMGLLGSHQLALDDDQVALLNGSLVFGATVGLSLAAGTGFGYSAIFEWDRRASAPANALAVGALTYTAVSAASIAGGIWAAHTSDFNTGEVLVINLGGILSSGAF
ncbi:MAG: hypothetical protein GY822_06215 [Deltaproteobacteria bacterium]|nr:hypothetical protein [Deltaproteobacteria bacterium]